ncbi:MAG: hypothetical protein IKY69_02830 [Bacteroidaceae bacterium]|nr:hypothetical protein [Bacteroidaceae bacterium]
MGCTFFHGQKDGGRAPPEPCEGTIIGGREAPGGRIIGGRGYIEGPGGGTIGGIPG